MVLPPPLSRVYSFMPTKHLLCYRDRTLEGVTHLRLHTAQLLYILAFLDSQKKKTENGANLHGSSQARGRGLGRHARGAAMRRHGLLLAAACVLAFVRDTRAAAPLTAERVDALAAGKKVGLGEPAARGGARMRAGPCARRGPAYA